MLVGKAEWADFPQRSLLLGLKFVELVENDSSPPDLFQHWKAKVVGVVAASCRDARSLRTAR